METIPSSTEYNSIVKPAARRALIFSAVVFFHVSIIILLMLTAQVAQPPQPRGMSSTLALFNLATPVDTPTESIMPINPVIAVPKPVEALSGAQGKEGISEGEVCSPLDQVTSQLATDPLVPAAIKRVAKADRSISEAIVMWNVEWSAVSADEAPLAEVRERVISILESLPADCLATPITGPRLIAITDDGYTTLLAFGSGQWSWQEVTEFGPKVSPVETNPWLWDALPPNIKSLQIF